jgi:hypothetical protein
MSRLQIIRRSFGMEPALTHATLFSSLDQGAARQEVRAVQEDHNKEFQHEDRERGKVSGNVVLTNARKN